MTPSQRGALLSLTLCLAAPAMNTHAQEESPGFVGGLRDEAHQKAEPVPVRNDAARPGDEIVTKRHFRIEKGEYPRFVQASRDGVWPYFEKLGARVLGMWLVIHPELDGHSAGDDDPGYDEVILMTRYASVDHWRATRETIKHGGNGPDWDACLAALQLRRSLTKETSLEFLQGLKWGNDPWFLPGLDERYKKVE